LHAALSKAGHECRIFDFHGHHQIDSISINLLSFSPELIGLSMVFTARAQEFVDIAENLKKKHGFNGHITAGGHFASFHAEQLLLSFSSIDTIIHGEGEQALVDLADNIDLPQNVNNISYRDTEGKIIRTGNPTNNPDLDSLAWPTRSLPLHTYLNLPIADIIGGRGCFGNCSFCSIAAWHKENGGLRYRFRSPEDIGKEMAYLYHECGARIFNFHDDNFFYPREKDSIDRFRKLEKILKKERVEEIAIQIKARPDSISQPVINILKRLGLFRVFLGIENNAVTGLKSLGRSITRECNHTALKILQKNDIHTTFNLLMFEPEMKPGDLIDNIAMLKECPWFPLNFGRVEVYSGTPLEQRLRKEGRLSGNIFGYTYTIKNCEMQTAFELFKKVFWGRNFEAEGMNHLSMRADYYYHLLKHFYPSLVTKDLSYSVKKSITNLNNNSADLLLSIHEFVTNKHNINNVSTDQFALELLSWREKYDTGARKEFLQLINRIETTVSEYNQSRNSSVPGIIAAAAVVIAVTSMN
ncbi:MAG: B12-binding domain-containing radical SAM protein, partial [Fibrobacter sp.]|nr:B12-binding domain-containing radical SAM protein [Fibrobacter sp.]